jgi:hypothetical protein
MMANEGKTVPLSLPRRLICDLLHFAQRIPSVPVQRLMNLHPLCDARKRAASRISWCALFLKGFGRMALEVPHFRRAYMSFPYARLYEHPYSIASVAFERRYRKEDAVFFGHFRSPETQTLTALDEAIRHYEGSAARGDRTVSPWLAGQPLSPSASPLLLVARPEPIGSQTRQAYGDFWPQRLFRSRLRIAASALAFDIHAQLRCH